MFSKLNNILMMALFALGVVSCAVGTDEADFIGGNKVDGGVIVPDLPIETPTSVSLVYPVASPNFVLSPRIRVGGVTIGHTANLYDNENCSGSPISSAIVENGNSVDILIEPELSSAGTYRYYAQMVSGELTSRCSGDDSIFATYILNPELGPSVTGLSHDAGPVNSKNWSWGCNKASCDYRFAVNTNATHSFSIESYTPPSSTSLGSGDGIYYLHVQPKDNGTSNTGVVQSYSVLMDNTAPLLSSVSISSNNIDSSQAIEGDIITLDFVSNELLSGLPTVTILGSVVIVDEVSENTYQAQYTVTDSDPIGTAPFSIDFTDVASNNGSQVTASTDASSINVTTLIPTLTSVEILSDNPLNSNQAKVGDIVTVNFTASESLQNVTAFIAGNPALISGGPLNWSATYSLASGDSEGVLSFSIDFEDLSANPGVQVTSTTNSSSVNFDKTIPTLTPVSIQSNNADVTKAKVGNNISLTFTASENLGALPTATIAGRAAFVTSLGGNNYVALGTMTSGDSEGVIPFTLDFVDMANNGGAQVTGTSDATTVNFDKTLPTLSIVSINSNNTNPLMAKVGDLITLNFTSSEVLDVLPNAIIAGKTATVTPLGGLNYKAEYTMTSGETDGVVSFSVDFLDEAGNNGVQVTSVTDASSVLFDKTMPTLSPVTIASNNSNSAYAKVGDIVTLNFTSSETLIANPNVTIGGKAVAVSGGPLSWAASYTMEAGDTEGVLGLTVDFTDSAGNIGTQVTSTTNASTMTFDKTIPTLTLVSVTSNNANTAYAKVGSILTLNFTASESLGPTPTVNINSAATTPSDLGANNYSATYTYTAGDMEGSESFTVDFVDQAGNVGGQVVSTTDASSVVFDKTAPDAMGSVSVALNDALKNQSRSASWSAVSDNGPAGLSHYEMEIGSTASGFDVLVFKDIGDVLTYQAKSPADFVGDLILYQDYYTTVRAVDNAGNVSTEAVSAMWQFAGPEVISDLSVGTTLANSVDLDWSQVNTSLSTIDDYEIEYRLSTGPGVWTSFSDGVNANTNATITGLVSNTDYDFRVRIKFDSTLISNWSNITSGKTKPDDPLFDNPYKAMNVGGSTDTKVVAQEDGTTVNLNGSFLISLDKGDVHRFTSSQYDIIDADKPIFTAGRLGSGADNRKANVIWNPTSWAGTSFSFNATRYNPQALYIYPAEDTTVQVFQGGVLLATATFTKDDPNPTSGSNPLSWSTYGSYQVVSTGTILTYHISTNAGRKVDPKPLPPAHTEIIGYPSNSMRLTTGTDSTNYNGIHSNSVTTSGSLSRNNVVSTTGQGAPRSFYQGDSYLINADQPISGASFADSNGFCAAPFLPTNLMKTKYVINNTADYVAFASKEAGTIDILDGDDNIVETLTLTRSGANPDAPYKARTQTGTGTTAGRRYHATVPVAAWYQPSNDTGSAMRDETVLYGSD